MCLNKHCLLNTMFTITSNIKNAVKLKSFQRAISYKFNKLSKLKSREEREAELQKQRIDFVRTSITSVLKNRKSLSVSEWKILVADMKTKTDIGTMNRNIFNVLLGLRRPHDALQNGLNFIESQDMKHDLGVKRALIQFYAKKAGDTKLTETEAKHLLDMLVY